MSKKKSNGGEKIEGLSNGSRLQVEHSGISPREYNNRNYIETRDFTPPQRVGDGLPKLPKVSKPQGLTETTPSRPMKVNRSVQEANAKDLKSRNIQ